MLPLLLLRLLLPQLFQQTTFLLLLLLLFLFLPPLFLLILLLFLLLDDMEPSGQQRPPLDLRGLDPLDPRFITNSDWVALSPQIRRLGGSLLTLGARRFALARGW